MDKLEISALLSQLENEAKSSQASVNKKHILVVDDERTILKLIKGILEDSYNVTTLSSGKTALQFFDHKSADLVLLDYEMPMMSGVEVLKALRSKPRTKNIPVIFITGINDKDKIHNALSLNPNAYLLKPINAARLRSEIRKLIG